jgi:hypothetical protein
MATRQSVCLRRLAGGARSGIVGFGRFISNPRVTSEALIEGWSAGLPAACAGRHVLAIQDTSEINFATTARRDRGLGKIGKGVGRGVLLHPMLALDAGTGALLGLVTGRVWTRDGLVVTPHAERPLSEKESERWLSTPEGAPVSGGVHRGDAAARALAEAGTDLILSGHLHTPFARPLPYGACHVVGAGTLSQRLRGTPAAYTVIEAEAEEITVTARGWTGARFETLRTWGLSRRAAGA